MSSSSSRAGGVFGIHRGHDQGWIWVRVRVLFFEQLGGAKSTAAAGDLAQPNRRLLSHCVLDASLQLGGVL